MGPFNAHGMAQDLTAVGRTNGNHGRSREGKARCGGGSRPLKALRRAICSTI
jgi:hypothetical protein